MTASAAIDWWPGVPAWGVRAIHTVVLPIVPVNLTVQYPKFAAFSGPGHAINAPMENGGEILENLPKHKKYWRLQQTT